MPGSTYQSSSRCRFIVHTADLSAFGGYGGTMPDNTMRTVHFYAYGGPEQLVVEQKPRPEPQVGEVLVRVHAAGVNPIDWKIRQGMMKDSQPMTFPYTPGLEVAGVVEEVGPGV